jgi:alkylhydroperoxidase family enzyme
MSDEIEELLRGLAVSDDRSLREIRVARQGRPDIVSARTSALVRLAALLAVDAPTASLQWATERAGAAGVRDEEIVDVLLTVGEAVGFARVVSAAPRLALAIGYDIEAVGWDGS